jgi:hypothetical protein
VASSTRSVPLLVSVAFVIACDEGKDTGGFLADQKDRTFNTDQMHYHTVKKTDMQH